MIEVIWAFLGMVFGAGVGWALLKKTSRDVNGLGRKFWASVACQLRCLAEELEEPHKAKLLHIADLIDPGGK